MDDGHGSFSKLQHLLQLSYSDNPAQQQTAAIELSKLVEGTVFPAVSFGPLAHALCRLVPNDNRTVSSYAARALKVPPWCPVVMWCTLWNTVPMPHSPPLLNSHSLQMLILDDALRPQAITAGVPSIVCNTIKKWDDEVLCLQVRTTTLSTTLSTTLRTIFPSSLAPLPSPHIVQT